MKAFWKKYEKFVVVIFVFFLGLFLYTKLAGPLPFYINSVNTTKTDLFSADGEGTVTAVPDTADINLGVTQTAATVVDAQNNTNKIADKIINDLKVLGISANDIKTTNYSINPNYGGGTTVISPALPNREGQNIISYTVTQNLGIKVKPIDKANKVVDTATADGANLVGGISFTFSDGLEKQLENQAMQQAVSNAKNKAQSLASAAGINLGRIVNVIQNSNQPRPLTYAGGETANSAAQQATPPTNVTPGQNTVTVDVVIYYETY